MDMEKATKNGSGLYRTLDSIEPPQGLYRSVMARIELARRRQAQIRAGLFAVFACASGTLLVPVLEYTSGQLYASGFYEYLSLAFSDRTLVLTYWREFVLSLVESLPSLALVLLLPLAAALIFSLVKLFKNARSAFAYARLT